jgi:hypothetical protein
VLETVVGPDGIVCVPEVCGRAAVAEYAPRLPALRRAAAPQRSALPAIGVVVRHGGGPCQCAVTRRQTLKPIAEIMPDRRMPDHERTVAMMGSLLPCRRARTLLVEFLPLGKPQAVDHPAADPSCWHQAGAGGCRGARSKPGVATKSMALSIDGGHVGAAARQHQGRTFEVLLAQVSNDEGKQVVFASVPAEATSQTRQLRGVVHGLGATPATSVTILSDGADGPRSLGEAASPGPTHHVLDWFHLAMRVQHVAQAATSSPDAAETDRQAGARLTEAIERIRWRLWHGQVRRALDLIAETIVTVDIAADNKAARKWRAFWVISRLMFRDNRISSSTTPQLADAKNQFRRRSPRARCNGRCIGEWMPSSKCGGLHGALI